jgi:DNA-binding transcriptional MocR family regulator
VFDPGSMFRPDGAATPLALRLCYSAAKASKLVEGSRRLAAAWHAYRRTRVHRTRARAGSLSARV